MTRWRPIRGVLKNPRPCHCEECGEVTQGVSTTKQSRFALSQIQARRLFRRPAPAGLLAMTIPRFFNSPKNPDINCQEKIAP